LFLCSRSASIDKISSSSNNDFDSPKYYFLKTKITPSGVPLSTRRNWLGLVALGCLLSAAGCREDTSHADHQPRGSEVDSAEFAHVYAGAGPIQVLCTTGMVADLVREVGGPHVEVSALMGAGVDPHLYKATPGDVSRLSAADIVFYSGWHLEGKMTEVFTHLARSKPCVAAAEGIPSSELLTDASGVADPHLWFDVRLWSQTAARIAAALSRFDPPHKSDYAAALEKYQSRLTSLHENARQQLAEIPREQRALVTAHDAFRYFGRAYDIEVHGVQGISTDSEAGVKQVNDLVDLLVRRKIKAVFVESSVSEQNVQALLEGCRARGHIVTIGGELFSDAMGDAGTPEGTYVGMIEHNVRIIATALR
jgi:manganese/zinc/iron transport system substrate-binding protein